MFLGMQVFESTRGVKNANEKRLSFRLFTLIHA